MGVFVAKSAEVLSVPSSFIPISKFFFPKIKKQRTMSQVLGLRLTYFSFSTLSHYSELWW
jgi:hypothetical protein